jgi:uncharacterized protein
VNKSCPLSEIMARCSLAARAAVLSLASLTPALIVANPGIHTTGPSQSTIPLVQALVEGNVSLANSLLDAGADPNALDVIRPLYAAQEYVSSRRPRRTIMSRLLRLGADVDGTTLDGTTTLMLAAYHGDVKCAELLLSHGADPLKRNDQGYDAVQAAAQSGNSELAEMLREYVGESGMRHSAEPRVHVEL